MVREGMRGADHQQNHMFSYLSPEMRVRKDHPLRTIRAMVDEVLTQLSRRFDAMYARVGRPSIPPEKLLRAQLLQMLYSIRSERLLMEEIDYSMLFRWFVGLNLDEEVWDATSFTKNRDRLLEADVAKEFREVLVGSQTLGPRLLHHLRQELLGHVGLQQPVAVLGEARRIPNLLVQVQPYEPAKQHAVINLFHQQTFAADRVQHLQQLRSQQLLRRNRRTPYAGVHGVEPPRQLGKHFIHHGPDGAQRMIFPHSHLRRQITEHVVLLMICSSHTFSYHSRRGMRSSFSAAC